jgi:hypothetical protein
MTEIKKIGFDLLAISEAFGIEKQDKCAHLEKWINISFEFTDFEQKIINEVHADIYENIESMNEEELKARLVGLLFYVAHIDEPTKIRVFYERPIATIINDYSLNVICDCLVATPKFNLPSKSYFFLQEFKKAKGEKKDPEAQMLTAMLIAQNINNDQKPIFGSYLIGSNWRFSTLIGKDYCVSRKFDAENINDLQQIVCILRHLKAIILNR